MIASGFRRIGLGRDHGNLGAAILVLAIIVAAGGLTGLAPIGLKWTIEALSVSPDASGREAALLYCFGYIAALGSARMLTELQTNTFANLEQNIHRNLRKRLTEHVLDLPMSFFAEHNAGSIVQLINNATRGATQFLQTLLLGLSPIAIQLITVAGVVAFLYHWEFFVILVASIIAYATVYVRGIRNLEDPQRATINSLARIGGEMTDVFSNAETTKFLLAERDLRAKLDQTFQLNADSWMHYYWLRAKNGIQGACVFIATLLVMSSLAWYEHGKGSMTLGDFVLINTYLVQIVRPLEVLGYVFRDLRQSLSFLEAVDPILGRTPERSVNDHRLLESRKIESAEVQLVDVSFGYLTSQPVFQSVNLVIPSGSVVAFVGMTGSGKSTVARLLTRLYEPQAGHIKLGGVDIRKLSIDELRSCVVVVPQDAVLYDDTIEFNLGLGANATEDAVQRAVKLADAVEFIERLPHGIKTNVGPRGVKLSGGQRQRIGIARSILRDPCVIVLDEVTASLDALTERKVMDQIRNRFAAATIIIIAHRLSTVMNADQIFVFEGGTVTERGTHCELIRDNGLYARFWAEQDIAVRSSNKMNRAVL